MQEDDEVTSLSANFDSISFSKKDTQVIEDEAPSNIENENILAQETMHDQDQIKEKIEESSFSSQPQPPPAGPGHGQQQQIVDSNQVEVDIFAEEAFDVNINVPAPVDKSLDIKPTEENTFYPTIDEPNIPFTSLHEHLHQNLQQTVVATLPFELPVIPSSVRRSSSDTFYIQNEDEAYYDLWLPSPDTELYLSNKSQNQIESSNSTDVSSNNCYPGIIYEEDLVDKVKLNMAKIFGEEEANKRKIISVDEVSQDENGLRELIKLCCYRSAINLTKRLLNLYGQGPGKRGQFSKHTPQSLQLWFTRISLFVRIREFGLCESEIQAFSSFDFPDLYYDYYDPNGKSLKITSLRSSMVPFHFRLLLAEIPQFLRRPNESFEKLYQLLFTTQQILKILEENVNYLYYEKALSLWKNRELRIYYSLFNASYLIRDYRNASNFLFKILNLEDEKSKAGLHSALGRLFVNCGDISNGEVHFKLASESRDEKVPDNLVENLLDSAILTMANGSYQDAFNLYEKALHIQPDRYLITNNMAVCLLYLGRVKECLALMEQTVKQNAHELLQENVIVNLSTVYELENSDGSKKNSILKLISEYKGDGINLSSLKMTNLI